MLAADNTRRWREAIAAGASWTWTHNGEPDSRRVLRVSVDQAVTGSAQVTVTQRDDRTAPVLKFTLAPGCGHELAVRGSVDVAVVAVLSIIRVELSVHDGTTDHVPNHDTAVVLPPVGAVGAWSFIGFLPAGRTHCNIIVGKAAPVPVQVRLADASGATVVEYDIPAGTRENPWAFPPSCGLWLRNIDIPAVGANAPTLVVWTTEGG